MNTDNFKEIYDNYLDLSQVNNITEYSKLEEAGNIIKNGGLVLFPTETVYGIGANGFDEEAVKKIFLAKGRKQGLSDSAFFEENSIAPLRYIFLFSKS